MPASVPPRAVLPFGYHEPGRAIPARSPSDPAMRPTLPRRRDPVETLWTFRAQAPRRFLVLPDGRADLILRFRAGGNEGKLVPTGTIPMVVGPSTVAHTVPVAPGDAFVGARLRPGRLGWLDATALRDRRLAGERAAALIPGFGDMMDAARDVPALLDGFARMLRALPPDSGDPLLDAALDRMHLGGGRIAPGDLARALGIGARRLHRLFHAHVGLAPSDYAAVLRFQRALRLRRRGLPIAATAHEAGYADQPHMTRAFRRHGGFTPARMVEAELGWMPIGGGNGT